MAGRPALSRQVTAYAVAAPGCTGGTNLDFVITTDRHVATFTATLLGTMEGGAFYDVPLNATVLANNGVVIKDVDAAIEALNSGVTDKYSLFIITETIEDVYRLAKGCKDIKEINLGGTRKTPETTLHPTPAIFATEKDAEHIQELLGDGVAIEIRQVPNDAKVFAKDVF